MFKVASWNVNSLRVRLPHVLDWLEQNPVDVLGLQELKLTNDQFPLEEIEAAGYQAIFNGQKTYNGVALLSKTSASDIITDLPDFDDPQRRVIGAIINDIFILNLYIPNGSEVGSEKYDYKLDWLDNLQLLVESLNDQYEEIIIMGDFNIAPTDDDVHDPAAWKDKVHCSEPERSHYNALIEKDFIDCFRMFNQEPGTFSWWDYRAAGFRRNLGLRIDHILASLPLAKSCKACYVDKNPRKLERPSDHAPVVAEFKL